MKVFLSHNRADKAIAEEFAIMLGQLGISYWFDKWELRPGDSIIDGIEKGLADCDIFLLIWSKSAAGSKWVGTEQRAYIRRRLDDASLKIIPVLVDDTPLPVLVAEYKGYDLRDGVTAREIAGDLAVVYGGTRLVSEYDPPLSCVVTCRTNSVRSEGMSELVGDIFLLLKPGRIPPGTSPIQSFDLDLFLNGSISRVRSGYRPTDAVLIEAGGIQTIPADLVGGNIIGFRGIRVDLAAPGTRVFRICNVRMLASGVSAGPGSIPGRVEALVSFRGSVPVVIGNPEVTVAYVRTGLRFQFEQLESNSPIPSRGTIRFSEQFPNVLKTIFGTRKEPAEPGQLGFGLLDPTSESGVCWQFAEEAALGMAQSGTRLKVVFHSVPPNATIKVSVRETSSSGAVRAHLTRSEVGPFEAVLGSDDGSGLEMADVVVQNGIGTATWEVIERTESSSACSIEFTVHFESEPQVRQWHVISLAGGLAPSASWKEMESGTAPLPRFIIPVQVAHWRLPENGG